MTPRKGRDFVPFGRGAWEEVLPDERSRFVLLFRLTMEADYKTGEVEGSSVEIAKFLGWDRGTYSKYLQELGDEVEVTKGVNRYAKGRVRLNRYHERLGLAAGLAAGETTSSSGNSTNSYNVTTSTNAPLEQDVQDSVVQSVDRSISAIAPKTARVAGVKDTRTYEEQRAFFDAQVKAEEQERQRRQEHEEQEQKQEAEGA